MQLPTRQRNNWRTIMGLDTALWRRNDVTL
jgi:hypothetical protein